MVSINRDRPACMGTVARRMGGLKFCSGSIVGDLRRGLTSGLNGTSNCSSCSLFLVGSKTRTGRGTLGLTSFRGKGGHIVTFGRTFRKHASTTMHIASGPGVVTPMGRSLTMACLPLGSTATMRTRLRGKSISSIVVRNVRNINNVRLPASSFVRRLHTLYAGCRTYLVLSRVRSKCKHDNGFFTRRCTKVGPSLVSITGNVNGNFPVDKLLVDPVFGPMCKVLNAAFKNGRLTYTTTVTMLRVVRRRGLVSGTQRMKTCLLSRLRGLPKVGRVHKHNLVVNVRFRRSVGRMHDGLLFRRGMFAKMTKAGAVHLLPPLYLDVSRTGRFVMQFHGILGTWGEEQFTGRHCATWLFLCVGGVRRQDFQLISL